MKFQVKTDKLRQKVNLETKSYDLLAEEIGVSRFWLPKFAQNKIINPTLNNLVKLEKFFKL